MKDPSTADRHPGRAWKRGPALAVVPAPRTERPVRIGYARTSTARQELASQLEALHRACPKAVAGTLTTRLPGVRAVGRYVSPRGDRARW
jgi:hypothetical protein